MHTHTCLFPLSFKHTHTLSLTHKLSIHLWLEVSINNVTDDNVQCWILPLNEIAEQNKDQFDKNKRYLSFLYWITMAKKNGINIMIGNLETETKSWHPIWRVSGHQSQTTLIMCQI